MRLPTDGNAFV